MSRWTRDQWISRCRPDEEVFAVPGLAADGDAPEVLLCGMSGAMRQRFLETLGACAGDEAKAGVAFFNLCPDLVRECARDPETREAIFPADADVASLPFAVLTAMGNKIVQISRLGNSGVEEIAKNSSSIPSGQPSSPLPTAGDAPPQSS